jgi:hypothetical protein
MNENMTSNFVGKKEKEVKKRKKRFFRKKTEKEPSHAL